MEHEAAADIAEDCLLDASKDCQDCANSRLIDRQREKIEELTIERDEYYQNWQAVKHYYNVRKATYESEIAALKEEIAAHVRGEA